MPIQHSLKTTAVCSCIDLVVALGPTPLLSVQSTHEDLVKVSPLSNPSPQVARQLELEPRSDLKS